MVLLHVLLIYHIKDVRGINHKLSYNTSVEVLNVITVLNVIKS